MPEEKQISLSYEGTLALNGGYRVIVIGVSGKDRCFPVGPNGHPLARTGYPSIDEAKQRIAAFREAGRSPDVDRLPPTALPPERRLPLEPLMDTVMRVEIRGIYVALLGIVLGGDAVMWILELPARHDSRASKIFRDEAAAVEAYESLCVELSAKYITTHLDDG
ncbi:MAG TPA: hypothetical protein VF254_01000 [Gammaproteobacteria bacterium]